MTTPVFTVPPDRLGGEVLFELLERGIRHAPVVSESGQLIGVIEDADLLAAPTRSWFGARRSISRAAQPGGPGRGGRRLPEVVSDLHAVAPARARGGAGAVRADGRADHASAGAGRAGAGRRAGVGRGGQSGPAGAHAGVDPAGRGGRERPGARRLDAVGRPRCSPRAASPARSWRAAPQQWASASTEGSDELEPGGAGRAPRAVGDAGRSAAGGRGRGSRGDRRRAGPAGARRRAADRVRRRRGARGRRHAQRPARHPPGRDRADRRAGALGLGGGRRGRGIDARAAAGGGRRRRAPRRGRADAGRRVRARARAAHRPSHGAPRGRARRRTTSSTAPEISPLAPRPPARRVPRGELGAAAGCGHEARPGARGCRARRSRASRGRRRRCPGARRGGARSTSR